MVMGEGEREKIGMMMEEKEIVMMMEEKERNSDDDGRGREIVMTIWKGGGGERESE